MIENQTIKSRIFLFIDYKKMNKSQFEKICGFSNGYLSNVKGGFSAEKLEEVLKIFPELNPLWLLIGEGSMLRSEENSRIATLAEPNEKGVPYYAIDFVGGFDFIYNSNKTNPDAFIACPTIKGAQCWVDVSGKSMEPLITPGDIIALRQVTDYANGVLYGEIYAIVTDDYRTVKKIKRCSNAGYITLVPENPDYDPQDLAISQIRALYKVLGCTKKFF